MDFNSRAFCRLQDDLFRLPFVGGVLIRGLGRLSDDRPARDENSVQVVTTEAPDDAMRQEIGEIVDRVNRRFGTHFRVIPTGPDAGNMSEGIGIF